MPVAHCSHTREHLCVHCACLHWGRQAENKVKVSATALKKALAMQQRKRHVLRAVPPLSYVWPQGICQEVRQKSKQSYLATTLAPVPLLSSHHSLAYSPVPDTLPYGAPHQWRNTTYANGLENYCNHEICFSWMDDRL